MEKELQIFKNEQFGEIRVIEIKNDVWMVGKDLVEALGYDLSGNSYTKYVEKHCDEEDCKFMNKSTVDIFDNYQSLGRKGGYLINESGMYSLVLSSELPTAKKFKRWVTNEVLPTIRKHGMYATDELLDNPDLLIQVATKLKEEREARKIAEKKNEVLNEENKLLAQENLEWADRNMINALIRKVGASIGYKEAWVSYKKELMYKHSIAINNRITNYLNTTGKKSKPKTLDMIHDDELPNAMSTAISLCRDYKLNIDDIICKFKNN